MRLFLDGNPMTRRPFLGGTGEGRVQHTGTGKHPCPELARRFDPSLFGFTLIELMIVISIILILISLAAPMYRTSIIRSKEAVLRDDLFTLRSLIDQYTVDKQEAPQSLQALVSAGYLRLLPVDPFTGSTQTWEVVFEDNVVMSPDQTVPGLVDVRSGSSLTSLSGEPYSSW